MTELEKGVSGYTIVKNALRLDYCVDLTIQSLLDVGCDEVVVCDADSDDGTREMLDAIAAKDLRVRIINYAWPNPNGQIDFFVKWLNYTRLACRYENQLQVDADEIVTAPKDYVFPNQPLWLPRYSFWRDSKHLIPAGRCCANWVVRYGATSYTACSDEMYGPHPGMLPGDEPLIRQHAQRQNLLAIWHLGFLRKREALFAKVENCLRYWFGSAQDTRLVEAMKHPDQHWTEFCKFDLPLVPYDGLIPEIAKEWLRERNAL